MILILWVLLGSLTSLLIAAIITIHILLRALSLRAEFIYALIGDRNAFLAKEVPEARAALGEVVRGFDLSGLGERVDQEERRAD